MEHARPVDHSRDLKVIMCVALTHVQILNTFSKVENAEIVRATRGQQQAEEPAKESLAPTMRFVEATAYVRHVHHIPHYPLTGRRADQALATLR